MELELDELPPLDDNPEDLVAGDILETPVRPPPSFLDEDAPLQLSDEEDADAEKLVQVESRVRELVHEADLETMTTGMILKQLKGEFDDELFNRHRKRLKEYVTHVAGERQTKSSKRQRNAMEEMEDLLARPAAADGEDLFEGVEAAQQGDEEEERGVDEEEEEDDYRPVKKGKKKRQAREKAPKKKKKERMAAEDQQVAEAPGKVMSSVLKAFKETSDALKARTGKTRGGGVEPPHEQLLTDAQQLVSDMQAAQNADIEHNEQGEPAIARLQMCAKVQEVMGKAFLGPQLVEAGVLDVLASWLRPLPRDGALPAGGVKRAVVGGLARLGVDWSEGGALTALKKSGIGRLVLAMSKDKDMPETARMAEKLVELWARPVFNITDDHKMMSEIDQRRGHQRGPATPSGKSVLSSQHQREIQLRVEQARKKQNNRAQIPYALPDELGGATVRPARKQAQAEDGASRRVSENASALMAGIQLFDEVAREVQKKRK